jgi:lysozyme
VSITPSSRPQMDVVDATKLLSACGVTGPAILAQRGYYLDSMGGGVEKRGIYEDMIAIVTPRTYRTFNANTVPSTSGGRLAVLQPGSWEFQKGIHHPGAPNGYPCLVQAGPVTVLRDNGVRETGEFYIHIHHGGYNETESAGCQTIHPDQWKEFYSTICDELDFYDLSRITYVLTVREDA